MLNVPVPLVVKLTEPVGVVAPVDDVSVTVAMHVVAWFNTTILGVQLTVVLVGCSGTVVTVKSKVSELSLWDPSPP